MIGNLSQRHKTDILSVHVRLHAPDGRTADHTLPALCALSDALHRLAAVEGFGARTARVRGDDQRSECAFRTLDSFADVEDCVHVDVGRLRAAPERRASVCGARACARAAGGLAASASGSRGPRDASSDSEDAREDVRARKVLVRVHMERETAASLGACCRGEPAGPALAHSFASTRTLSHVLRRFSQRFGLAGSELELSAGASLPALRPRARVLELSWAHGEPLDLLCRPREPQPPPPCCCISQSASSASLASLPLTTSLSSSSLLLPRGSKMSMSMSLSASAVSLPPAGARAGAAAGATVLRRWLERRGVQWASVAAALGACGVASLADFAAVAADKQLAFSACAGDVVLARRCWLLAPAAAAGVQLARRPWADVKSAAAQPARRRARQCRFRTPSWASPKKIASPRGIIESLKKRTLTLLETPLDLSALKQSSHFPTLRHVRTKSDCVLRGECESPLSVRAAMAVSPRSDTAGSLSGTPLLPSPRAGVLNRSCALLPCAATPADSLGQQQVPAQHLTPSPLLKSQPTETKDNDNSSPLRFEQKKGKHRRAKSMGFKGAPDLNGFGDLAPPSYPATEKSEGPSFVGDSLSEKKSGHRKRLSFSALFSTGRKKSTQQQQQQQQDATSQTTSQAAQGSSTAAAATTLPGAANPQKPAPRFSILRLFWSKRS
eukprot:m51a1_g724 hypothetical protein (671) ;mRNA; f:458972-462096